LITEQQVCPNCGGSGWRIIEKGGVAAGERCSCLSETREHDLVRKANIPPLYHHATFENFSKREDHPLEHEAIKPVFKMVWSYARLFPATDKPGLLLVGDTGTGKTYLAVSVMKVLMSRGFGCVFFDFNKLIDQIRDSWDAGTKVSNRDVYREAMEAEVLVLDDLGALRTIDWVQDVLTSIVTHRCNERKPLIATTNLPDPDAMQAGLRSQEKSETRELRRTLAEAIGERARSRLFEMCHVIRMPAMQDYRVRSRR
jgi:DNA replication protein DnaC